MLTTMNNFLLSLASVAIISLVSLAGVFTLSINKKRLNRILFLLISLSVGALFGDVFIHILPEIFVGGRNPTTIAVLIFTGIIIFFIVEKILRWRHSHDLECEDEHCEIDSNSLKHLGQINIISDGLHNLLDGIVIGASYIVSVPLGVATTLAVFLHEIPQEIGDFGLLIHAGYSRNRALFLNFLSALAAVVGVLIAYLLGANVEDFISIVLPIAAGGFLYIAGSDLVPELHKISDPKRSLTQLMVMIIGFGLMALILFLEV